MFNREIGGAGSLTHIRSDHDSLFEFHRCKTNLRIPDVTEVTIVSYVPIANPFVECVVGTIRWEYLDQGAFWTTSDLEKKVLRFRDYYKDQRNHHALNGVTPTVKTGRPTPKVADLNNFRWRAHCRGLY